MTDPDIIISAPCAVHCIDLSLGIETHHKTRQGGMVKLLCGNPSCGKRPPLAFLWLLCWAHLITVAVYRALTQVILTCSFSPLPLLAPPSAPKMLLQVPSDPQTGQWALLCVTGGFHPNHLTLTWSSQTVADIDHPLDSNCTFPFSNPHVDLSTSLIPGAPTSDRLVDSMFSSTPQHQPKCFQVTDHFDQERHLVSVFLLPMKQSLDTGITYTCTIQDHPALTTTLSATFTWGKLLSRAQSQTVSPTLLLMRVRH